MGLVIISKNSNFSSLNLGTVFFGDFEDESIALNAVSGISGTKLAAIDVFFKSVKNFKGKIKNAWLLHDSFSVSKYNLFDTSKVLSSAGTPNITNAGYLPSTGNLINTGIKFNNQTGNLFAFQNNSITGGGDGLILGADENATNGTITTYITKDLLTLGACGFFYTRPQTDSTKYLNKGSILLNMENGFNKLYLDGTKQAEIEMPGGYKGKTEDIYIGGFANNNNKYTARIGFVSIATNDDFSNQMTEAEISIYHNAVNALMTALGI